MRRQPTRLVAKPQAPQETVPHLVARPQELVTRNGLVGEEWAQASSQAPQETLPDLVARPQETLPDLVVRPQIGSGSLGFFIILQINQHVRAHPPTQHFTPSYRIHPPHVSPLPTHLPPIAYSFANLTHPHYLFYI